jgi:tetratricopeptide (TPR) repeat protein
MKPIEQALPIGPLYAEQFRRNGIQTLKDLASTANLEDLSVRTEIPFEALLHWHQLATQKIKVGQYRNRVILLLALVVAIALTYEIRHWLPSPDLNAQGDALYDDGNYAEALDRYEKAAKGNPRNATAYAGKGAALRMLDRCPEAQVELSKAIELDPKYARSYIDRGACDARAAEYATALVEYDKAIQVEPNNRTAHGLAGAALRRLGKFPSAMEELNKAIELNPNYVWAYNERAHVWSDQGKYAQAIDDYNAALALNKDYKYAYVKAFPLLMLNRYPEALDAVNDAIKLDPKWTWPYAQRGSIYHDYLFNFEPAYQDLKTVSDLGEHDEDLDFAEAALTTNRLQEAYDLAHKQIAPAQQVDQSVDPSDQCTARFIAVAVLLMQNNNAPAKAELEDFIRYFQAVSPHLRRHWNYSGTQRFVRGMKMDRNAQMIILDLTLLLQDQPTVNIEQIEALVRRMK